MSRLANDTPLSSLITANAWSFGMLCKVRSIAYAGASDIRDGDALTCDTLGQWGLHANTSGGNKLWLYQNDDVAGTPAHRASATGGATSGTTFTATITPAVDDLFYVFAVMAATGTPSCTDNNGGTYTPLGTAVFNGGSSTLAWFARAAKLANTTSTIVTVTTSGGSGGQIVVEAVSGMRRVGAASIRNSGFQDGTGGGDGGGTPVVTLASSGVALTTSVTLGAVGINDSAGVMTEPSGWTERQQAGQGATPNVGLETITRDSGFSGTSVTWGASAGGNPFSAVILELDGSAALSEKKVGVPINLNEWTFIHGTYDGGTSTLRAGANGVWQTSVTGVGNMSSALGIMQLGRNSMVGAGNHFDGEILAGFLSPTVISDLNFTAARQELANTFVLPLGSFASANVLTASAGSFVEAGTATGLTAQRKISCVVATYTETPTATGLNFGHAVSVSAASFAETPTATGLTAQRKISCVAAAYAETGTATGLYFGRKIACTAATYSESPTATGLYFGHKTACTTAAYLETPTATGLTTQRKISAIASAYALTSIAAILAPSFPVSVGSFALSGTATGLAAQRKISCTAASYTESPTTSGLYFGRAISAVTATYTDTPAATGLTAQRKLSLTAGLFTETGTATGLYFGRKISCVTASYTESPTATGLTAQRKISLTAAAYTDTGNAAGLYFGHRLSATASPYVLAGQSVLLDGDMLGGIGAFSLNGTAALLTYTPISGHPISVNTGVFTLSPTTTSLTAQRKISCTAGAYAEAGVVTSLAVNRGIQAVARGYSEVGNSAGLIAQRYIAPATRAYSLAGVADQFSLTRKLSLAAGSFLETGTATGVKAQRKSSLSVGGFALSGTATGLRRGLLVPAVSAAYGESGPDTSLRAARLLSGGTGSFLTVEPAAGLSRGLYVAAAAGGYSSTFTDIQIGHGHGIFAVPIVYAFSGISAGLTNVRIITLDAATSQYHVSGKAAILPNAIIPTKPQATVVKTSKNGIVVRTHEGESTLVPVQVSSVIQ